MRIEKKRRQAIDFMNTEDALERHLFDYIKGIMDKSKCHDIFQETKLYDYQMHPQVPYYEIIKFNKETKKK